VIPKPLQQAHLDGVPARAASPRSTTRLLRHLVAARPGLCHSGIMPGYESYMLFYPELQVAVALQYNTDNPRQSGDEAHGRQLAGIVQTSCGRGGAKKSDHFAAARQRHTTSCALRSCASACSSSSRRFSARTWKPEASS